MDDTADIQQTPKQVCANCGAKLKGDYCRKCGEKKIVPDRDFSMFKFFSQTLSHFAHFDSKLLKSYWLLLSKPGFLTSEWTIGRRVRYMKPLQIFVVTSLLFYFFLPTTTAHFTAPNDLEKGFETQNLVLNTFRFDVEHALAEKASALNLESGALYNNILEEASHHSKTWLFLLIPFWGALIFLFFRKRLPWLVPHLIFALHGLTFYILSDLIIHAVFYLVGFANVGKYIFLVLMLTFPVYQALAIRRIYNYSWPVTLLKTAGIAAGFIVLILLYRQIMTILTILLL